MSIQKGSVAQTLSVFRGLDLLTVAEAQSVLWLFSADFPFRQQLQSAESIHLHIKVGDTATLPHTMIRSQGGAPQSEQNGYIKYAFDTGINLIFSSIPVAEEDRLPDAPAVNKPFLDHAGVDMREETASVRALFDAIPCSATDLGWRHVAQGNHERAVFCCHTQVKEKHWIYPPADLRALTRPLEFAFGPLVTHGTSMGCDLRPLDPAYVGTVPIACCGPRSEICEGSACT